MPNANHLINALAADDKDEANSAFESMVQDRLADQLEVRKVELASTIFDDLEEATSAERQYVRQVASVGRAWTKPDGTKAKRSIHQGELKAHARKNLRKLGPETVQYHADVLKQVRQNLKAMGKMPGLRKEEALDEGGPTRKHFQQTADLLKNIPDEAKRKELAQHHAGLYKAQNPRFDRAKFMSAAGVNEEALDEVIQGGSKNASAAPSNAALNRNVMMNIRKAVQTLRLKGVNPTAAAAGHRDFGKLAAKNPKAPGYMLMRKLQANKASNLQSLTQAGVPLGSALEANPAEFGTALQRIKRFK